MRRDGSPGARRGETDPERLARARTSRLALRPPIRRGRGRTKVGTRRRARRGRGIDPSEPWTEPRPGPNAGGMMQNLSLRVLLPAAALNFVAAANGWAEGADVVSSGINGEPRVGGLRAAVHTREATSRLA